MSEPDGIGYQQVYQCLKIIMPNFNTSQSIIKKKSGQSLVQILETVQNVRQIIKEHPSTFVRRLRQQVKLCYGTYQKIFKKDINLFPFVCCKK
jgi:ubiquinone biosynthesis protein Coq4